MSKAVKRELGFMAKLGIVVGISVGFMFIGAQMSKPKSTEGIVSTMHVWDNGELDPIVEEANPLTFDSIVEEIQETFPLDITLLDKGVEIEDTEEVKASGDVVGIYNHSGYILVEDKHNPVETLLHEIGHALDDGDGHWIYSESKEFMKLYGEEVANYYQEMDDEHYALTSRQEAFCEIFAETILNGEKVEIHAPKTYYYIINIAREYLTLN